MTATKPQGLSAKPAGAAAAAILLAGGVAMHFEGLSLTGYADPINISTACWGHTGDGVTVGKRYTIGQCEAWRDADLLEAAQAVDKCIYPPMTVNQWAALTSFTFNVGGGAFCKSTLAKKANAGDWKGACAELSRWVYAGGIRFNGLVKRRQAERALCEKP